MRRSASAAHRLCGARRWQPRVVDLGGTCGWRPGIVVHRRSGLGDDAEKSCGVRHRRPGHAPRCAGTVGPVLHADPRSKRLRNRRRLERSRRSRSACRCRRARRRGHRKRRARHRPAAAPEEGPAAARAAALAAGRRARIRSRRPTSSSQRLAATSRSGCRQQQGADGSPRLRHLLSVSSPEHRRTAREPRALRSPPTPAEVLVKVACGSRLPTAVVKM